MAVRGKAALWATIAGIVVFAVVVTVSQLNAMRPKPVPKVELAEAEALFNRAVQLVQDKRFDALCEEIAEIPQTCRTSLKNTFGIGWRPGPEPPRIVGVENGGPGFPPLILNIAGERDDGTMYTADFGVTKDHDGRVVCWYPDYWSGVDLTN